MDGFKVLLLVGCLSGLAGPGCGQEEQPVPSHTLFGSITSTSIDASQRWAFVQLTASGTPGVLYTASCQLAGPGCTYQKNFIEEGRYTVLAFIDMNDNAETGSLDPDSGDLAAQARPLILWEKTEMDFEDDLWRAVRKP